MIFNQLEFDLRCEWGIYGVTQLAPISDVAIIVDVLSFSTCVEIATNRGAIIFPYRWQDDTAIAYARSVNAILASRRRTASAGYSLCPSSMSQIPTGTRLVAIFNWQQISMRVIVFQSIAIALICDMFELNYVRAAFSD